MLVFQFDLLQLFGSVVLLGSIEFGEGGDIGRMGGDVDFSGFKPVHVELVGPE